MASSNPDWTRDEAILALDLYLKYKGNPPAKTSSEISSLSELLNRLARRLGMTGGSDFRNTNGVYMKLMNFRRLDPAYSGRGLKGLARGARVDERVWEEFSVDPPHCAVVAAAIRATTESTEPLVDIPDDE